jgi:ABC-2 type transport system permease protein
VLVECEGEDRVRASMVEDHEAGRPRSIPLDFGNLLRVLALSPDPRPGRRLVGVRFFGFVRDPRVAAIGVDLLVFPQMFLAGALIPIQSSSGVLGLLAKLMPMTYSINLARNIFSAGKPEYALAVLHPLWLDVAVTGP